MFDGLVRGKVVEKLSKNMGMCDGAALSERNENRLRKAHHPQRALIYSPVTGRTENLQLKLDASRLAIDVITV